ncbi:hypothetical protein BH23CHL2_BH23CHL2_30740 [soil metagenome]
MRQRSGITAPGVVRMQAATVFYDMIASRHASAPVQQAGARTQWPSQSTRSGDQPFFDAPRNQSGAASRFGFTGEPTDTTTGTLDPRTHNYDPNTDRFLWADTVQLNALRTRGSNRYAGTCPELSEGLPRTRWATPTRPGMRSIVTRVRGSDVLISGRSG